MTGRSTMVRLFEKTASGLLVEVAPENAAAARATRRFSRLANVEFDVLWTADEEAAHEAQLAEQETRAEQERADEERATRERGARVLALKAKLGLSDEDMDVLRSAMK